MDPDLVKMGKRMQNIRISHNMTQEKLGEILGLTANQISRVENAGSAFSLVRLILFCKYFKCSLDYVVFGNENNPVLSKLPEKIVSILSMEDSKDQDILLSYINMFEVLYNRGEN